MAEYNIQEVHNKILNILLQVDSVCQKHNLRYFIIAGTLLGAVRHKGFIPWDDDLDIAMPRPDYDTLMAHAHEWMPEPMEVVAYETDKEYPLPFAKIQDASTTLIERLHLKYLGGIYIDVFPLDGVGGNLLQRKFHFARYKYFQRVQYLIGRDPFRHGHGPDSWIPWLLQKIYTMQGVQRTMQKLQKRWDYDTCFLVVDHDDGYKGIMSKDIIGDPTPILFEGHNVMGVAKPHEYLSQKYGEYMVIPPHDKQRQHNFNVLDLNTPYRNYPKE